LKEHDVMRDPLLIDVPERLLTPRLLLRCPRAGDGPAVNEAVSISLDELRPWMPWAQTAPTLDQSEANVRAAQANFLQRSDLVYTIWEHDGQGVETRLMGSTGLHRIDWSVPRFEIGYWRRSGEQGRGLVTEAVRALSRMAFDVLKAQRVEIRMDDLNTASWKTAERAGFTLEGVLRRDTVAVDGRVRDTRVYSRVRGVEEAAASGG
jgi:RimJ/RimL family protein N-acetyltransferase